MQKKNMNRTPAKNSNKRYKKAVNKRNMKPIITRVRRPLGEPDIVETQVIYYEKLHLTGATQIYTFRANSLFDPNQTGTGTQPYYFDQYIATFEKYRVTACRIKLTATNISQAVPCEITFDPITTPFVPVDDQVPYEIPRAHTTGILPAYQSLPRTITTKIATEAQIGMHPGVVYTPDYAALFSANPVELWYYQIYAWTPATTMDVYIDVTLIFDCEFFDRAPVTASFQQRAVRNADIRQKIHNHYKLKELNQLKK